jgi:hypothetical protein
VSESTHHQVGLTVPQVRAILKAADEAESDSVLVRVEKGAAPGPVEVWLFSEAAEGIVGMIEVDEAGAVSELED